jgi:hypothetical protein
MPQDDVAQLVRHDAGDFIIRAGRLEHAAVQKHRAAGQREGVDLPKVDDIKGVSKRRLLQSPRNVSDESTPDPFDERVGRPIVQHWQLLADFGRRLAPKLHIL